MNSVQKKNLTTTENFADLDYLEKRISKYLVSEIEEIEAYLYGNYDILDRNNIKTNHNVSLLQDGSAPHSLLLQNQYLSDDIYQSLGVEDLFIRHEYLKKCLEIKLAQAPDIAFEKLFLNSLLNQEESLKNQYQTALNRPMKTLSTETMDAYLPKARVKLKLKELNATVPKNLMPEQNYTRRPKLEECAVKDSEDKYLFGYSTNIDQPPTTSSFEKQRLVRNEALKAQTNKLVLEQKSNGSAFRTKLRVKPESLPFAHSESLDHAYGYQEAIGTADLTSLKTEKSPLYGNQGDEVEPFSPDYLQEEADEFEPLLPGALCYEIDNNIEQRDIPSNTKVNNALMSSIKEIGKHTAKWLGPKIFSRESMVAASALLMPLSVHQVESQEIEKIDPLTYSGYAGVPQQLASPLEFNAEINPYIVDENLKRLAQLQDNPNFPQSEFVVAATDHLAVPKNISIYENNTKKSLLSEAFNYASNATSNAINGLKALFKKAGNAGNNSDGDVKFLEKIESSAPTSSIMQEKAISMHPPIPRLKPRKVVDIQMVPRIKPELQRNSTEPGNINTELALNYNLIEADEYSSDVTDPELLLSIY